MSHDPHALLEEFPDHADRIHELKANDAHFARIADRYHELNHEIIRIESGLEPTSDEVLEDFKKQRLHLLDEIAGRLRA